MCKIVESVCSGLHQNASVAEQDLVPIVIGTAKEVLNNYNSQDLKDIIKIFGDEEEASKIAKNVKKHQKCSILEAKLTACQASTTSRGDLTHKSAVMYDQIRASTLNVKGKSLALAYCCWRSLLLLCCYLF